ncbi:MAG: hypothetical protein KJO07_03500, partial [Deltaproteobacteria bacterium]|nr:hypothetical protein [Deltaproteobacteria bacterium]
VCWALGRCGSGKSVDLLRRIYHDTGEKRFVRLIAAHALKRVYGDDEKLGFEQALAETLPDKLAVLAKQGPATAVMDALKALVNESREHLDHVPILYLIGNQHTRPAVLDFARTAPMEVDYFPQLRSLFKAAELHRDAELYGLLTYRFETTRGNHYYSGYYYYRRDYDPNKPEPYSATTRIHFRKRAWRTLRRLAEIGSPDYVKLAVGMLLPYTDDDGNQKRSSVTYDWDYNRHYRHWDHYSAYWSLNGILYYNSPRYHKDVAGRAWRCAGSYKPGDPAPEVREEAFPELWDRMPQGLLHLLDESECRVVHEFAARAALANPDFLAELDAEVAIMLLGKRYEVTAMVGLAIAEQLYQVSNPNALLIRAAAASSAEAARKVGLGWVEFHRQLFIGDSAFLADLVISQHADVREFSQRFLRAAIIPDDVARATIGRIVAHVSTLTTGDEQVGKDIADTIVKVFGDQLGRLGIEVVRDLLSSPVAAIQELAGTILLSHSTLASQAPDDVLVALLDSPHAEVRAVGVKLVGKLSDIDLLKRRELLYNLVTHELDDLRSSAAPIVSRLAATHREFRALFFELLSDGLLRKADDGIHASLLALIKDGFRSHFSDVSKDRTWKLLRSRYDHAQELGGMLMALNLGPEDFEVSEIVKLASHDILAVRTSACQMVDRALSRFKAEMGWTVKLLDAKWPDSRHFAFELFRSRLDTEHLTPTVLVAVCDSIVLEVRDFGRELISKHFDGEHGHEYLIKLAEHPSEDLQLFASAYLESYATGHLERIREMEPYFRSVLSRVNRGRVARQRCIAFLRQQALANREAAEFVAGLVSRQSATMAIGDKAAYIETMVAIHAAYPDIDVVIEPHDPEVRGGV